MDIIEQWLANKIYHKEIGEYLEKNLYIYRIAIYGAGKLGELLYDDLVNYEGIKVSYFIDKYADSLYYGIDDMEILNLQELKDAAIVDAIIVTPYHSFTVIKNDLESILQYKPKIISLEDIIYKVE